MRRSLMIHPDTPGPIGLAVTVESERAADGELKVRFDVTGPVADLMIPPPAPGGRKDELWRTTCLEVFVRAETEAAYCEFNLSPSTEWAAYRFDGYRAGMAPIEPITAPTISGSVTEGCLQLAATIHIPETLAGRELRLGLSAILETRDGTRSYWALAHPEGKPDFHHADCFAAKLAAPEGA
jgi:hypothetical protein